VCVRPSSTYREPVTGELDAGEGLMARWLNERGYPFEFEPDWGVPTCPDFRVRHGSNIVAIEVKTIEGQGLFTNVRVGDHGFRPMDKALKPLREKIHAAARQLKPLAGTAGSLATLPQEHDMITHTLLTAHIAYTGQAAPWAAFPVDLLSGTPASFYPAGFHSVAALVADLGASPVVAVNATMVVVLGLVLPLGLVALATQLGRVRRPLLVGASASLLASVAYRPTFALLHDGGVLANLAGIAFSAGALAGILAVSRATAAAGLRTAWRGTLVGVVLVVVLAVAVFSVHPTAAVSVAVLAAAWLIVELMRREERRVALRRLAVLAVAGGLATGAAAPLFATGGASQSTVAGWPREIPVQPLGAAVDRTFGMPYAGYLDPQWLHNQTLLAVLVLVGALAAVLTRRALGLLAAWAVWSVALLLFLTGSAAPGVGTLAGFFYNNSGRFSGMVAPVQWLLGGLAVVTVVELVLRVGSAVAARGARGPVPEGLVAGLVAVVGVVLLVLTSGYRTTNAVAVAERYADSPINRIGPDDLAAFAYLRATVGPGERVMNSANDGSTYAYVLDRVPVVEVASLGSGAYTEELLARFDRLATDPDVRALVRRLDIRWVLVDADAPAIGVFEPDYPWYHGGDQFTTAPGLEALNGVEGLVRRFSSGSVSVYQVRDSVFEDHASAYR